jgi:hypothetical protein
LTGIATKLIGALLKYDVAKGRIRFLRRPGRAVGVYELVEDHVVQKRISDAESLLLSVGYEVTKKGVSA